MRVVFKISIFIIGLFFLLALYPLKANADVTLVWSQPEQVSNLSGNNSPSLSMGTDSNNTVHAVWEAQGGEYGGNPIPAIYYSNKPVGGSWTTPVNLLQNFRVFDTNNVNLFLGETPNLFIDNHDKVHIAWAGFRAQGDAVLPLFYAVRNTDGSWTYPSSSPLFWPNVSALHPVINVEQGGKVNLVYVNLNDSNIYYSTRASDNSSDPWSQPINLSQGAGGNYVTMTSDSDGNVYVAWSGSNNIKFSEKIGATWTTPQTIFQGSISKIITDNNKNLHLFFYTNYFPNNIVYSEKEYGSSDWSPAVNLPTNSSGFFYNPSATIDSNNKLHVTYIDGGSNIWYTSNQDSTWSSPIKISNYTYTPADAGKVPGVDIAIDNNNLSHVIWYQSAKLYYSHQQPRDSVAPITTLIQNPQPNSNNWNNTDVNISLDATDNDGGSGVKEIHYSVNGGADNIVSGNSTSFIVSTEGTNTINYWSVDNAGNIEQTNTYSLKIDKTNPIITINSPIDGLTYILNQPVVANWSAIDSLSGFDYATGTVASGQNIDTSTVGAHTFEVTAVDLAGNTVTKIVTYYVNYNFGGFQSPLGNNKLFKTGGTIPIKFQLTDYNGNIISNATVYLYIAKITNDVIGTDEAAISTSNADTGNQFRYDSTNNIYIYNLSTQNAPLGSPGTYQLKASLDDGSYYTTTISLK